MKRIEFGICLFVIILLFYIVSRHIYKKNGRCPREGLENATNPYRDPLNLPLKEYAIFSSFNSAYDGTQNTIQQLSKVMYSGCRFIDFNVFHVDGELYVGYSRDNMPVMTDTSLKLSQAIQYINTYAFTIDKDAESRETQSKQMQFVKDIISPGSMNATTIQQNYTKYPLFVNIRVYRPATSSLDIVEQVHKLIADGLKNRYVENGSAKPITKDTRLKELTKKVILTFDYQNILQIYSGKPPYDAKNIPPATQDHVSSLANIMIGGDDWGALYSYADVNRNTYQILEIKDAETSSTHSYETNANTMKFSYPSYSDEVANPDSYKYIQNYKIQTVPNRFYVSDANLEKYIKLFSDNKNPFLPLYYANSYIVKNASS